MSKKYSKIIACVFVFIFVACFISACNGNLRSENIWDSAIHTKDTQFGDGDKTIQVEVKVIDKSVTFTINTDKNTVGEALLEHNLISGEEGPYGLYVKSVNGILADYEKNQSYWAFEKNGEYMMTGVDSAEISDGEHYEIIYTK